jgi:hypothetical protein
MILIRSMEGTGRPSKGFNDSGERSKRKKVQKFASTTEKDLIKKAYVHN